MAGGAVQFSVAFVQGKIGDRVVKRRIIPARRYMTGFAFRAVDTPVIVFGQVAADAGTLKAVLEVFSRVTILTVETTVPVCQSETGFL